MNSQTILAYRSAESATGERPPIHDLLRLVGAICIAFGAFDICRAASIAVGVGTYHMQRFELLAAATFGMGVFGCFTIVGGIGAVRRRSTLRTPLLIGLIGSIMTTAVIAGPSLLAYATRSSSTSKVSPTFIFYLCLVVAPQTMHVMFPLLVTLMLFRPVLVGAYSPEGQRQASVPTNLQRLAILEIVGGFLVVISQFVHLFGGGGAYQLALSGSVTNLNWMLWIIARQFIYAGLGVTAVVSGFGVLWLHEPSRRALVGQALGGAVLQFIDIVTALMLFASMPKSNDSLAGDAGFHLVVLVAGLALNVTTMISFRRPEVRRLFGPHQVEE